MPEPVVVTVAVAVIPSASNAASTDALTVAPVVVPGVMSPIDCDAPLMCKVEPAPAVNPETANVQRFFFTHFAVNVTVPPDVVMLVTLMTPCLS